MTDDIVDRLRSNVVSQKDKFEAALLIELLRRQLQAPDDLVARLRELERDLIAEDGLKEVFYLPTIGEAADEIERLRDVISKEATDGSR